MAVLTRHAPGTFAWPELATKDQNAAKKFYSDLFGWAANDIPMGPDQAYTIFQKNGKDVAALATLQKEEQAAGVPPHWNAYVTVANVDDSAQKTTQLGGKVVAGPFDVMDHGRMAVIQDPTGAMLCLWQGKNTSGVGILNEVGALCWTELLTPDTAKAGKFYTQLIGWKSEEMDSPGPNPGKYTIFKRADDAMAGGMMSMPPQAQGPPAWLSYFQVEDTDALVDKATKAGAKPMMKPTNIPTVGRFSVIMDPQGAVFCVLGPEK